MTTYEEDMVDAYYNLKGYFTMKNIPFSAIEKRPGGKGRGEIDILAIKAENGKVKDAIHIEVSVSVASLFPFTTLTEPTIDGSFKILKKFFRNDSESQIKKIFGNTKFRRILISSEFSHKASDKLKKRISDFGGKVVRIKEKDEKIFLTVKDSDKQFEIEIIPFTKVIRSAKKIFKKKNLKKKNFQDPRCRTLQYLSTHTK